MTIYAWWMNGRLYWITINTRTHTDSKNKYVFVLFFFFFFVVFVYFLINLCIRLSVAPRQIFKLIITSTPREEATTTKNLKKQKKTFPARYSLQSLHVRTIFSFWLFNLSDPKMYFYVVIWIMVFLLLLLLLHLLVGLLCVTLFANICLPAICSEIRLNEMKVTFKSNNNVEIYLKHIFFSIFLSHSLINGMSKWLTEFQSFHELGIAMRIVK